MAPRKVGRIPLVSLAASWVILGLGVVVSGSLFPDRHATNACSLFAIDNDELLETNCQVASTHGGSAGGLLMSFGETNCTVHLTNCVPGTCYSIIDRTQSIETDDVPRVLPDSFFSSVDVQGASGVRHTRSGIAFRPEGSRVTLHYSTHACGDFYWHRGRVGTQVCGRPIPAVSPIDAGVPYALPCA